MKRWCLTILMIIALTGCARTGKIHLETREYETDTAVVEIQAPSLTGMADTQWQTQLNEKWDQEINACLEEFTTEGAQDQSTEKNIFRLTQHVMCDQNDFISLVSEYYVFTGGSYGATDRSVYNLDLQQNKELKLADLFLDGGYRDKLNEKINEILEKNPGDYQDLWEKPILGAAQEAYFYIHNGDLVLFYPPYELSYYARGFVEFRIPIQDLTGYIKPEYMRLA